MRQTILSSRRPTVAMIGVVAAGIVITAVVARAYPPAVGITAKSRSCTACHDGGGPWSDETRTIVDILDAKTRESLKQPDGSFRIEVGRGDTRSVITVIGRTRDDTLPVPRRNAWAYVDPTQIATSSLSKFAPGWDVNLPLSCRLVGDQVDLYGGAHLTALPMTIRPTDAARDADVELQVMLTAGDAVKGKADEGLIANYLMRSVHLRVVDR